MNNVPNISQVAVWVTPGTTAQLTQEAVLWGTEQGKMEGKKKKGKKGRALTNSD